MRVLLVEDDEVAGAALGTAARSAGFSLDWIRLARSFRGATLAHNYDCILLDLHLPDGRGELLLHELRGRGDPTPVIVITAERGPDQTVQLLDQGADDYVTKPFAVPAVAARIRAVVRRGGNQAAALSTVHGPLALHAATMSATWHGRPMLLRRKEYWLLEALLRQRHRVLSRSELEEKLYGWGEEVESNTVQVYVHHLRRKFCPALIVNVRGLGYRIGDPQSLGRPA